MPEDSVHLYGDVLHMSTVLSKHPGLSVKEVNENSHAEKTLAQIKSYLTTADKILMKL